MKFAKIIVTGMFCSLVGLGSVARAGTATFTSGDVFIGVASGQVQWRHADGTLVQTLDTTLGGYTTGMAFDAAGNLYVTGFSVNQVSVFNTSGILQGTFGSGYGTPEAIVFDAAGNVYVGGIASAGIRKFDSGGVFQSLSASGVRVDWMDLAADQKTMLYTQEGRAIKRHDVSSDTALSDFAALPGEGEAFALRLLRDGGVLLADADTIKRLDSSGAVVQTYDAPGEDSWFALNLDPDGTSFWSADFATADVYKFDIASGNVLLHFNTGTGGSTVYGLVVFGELVAAVPPSLVLSPEIATNQVGTAHVVTLTASSNALPVVGLTVDFTVSGANSASGSRVTDDAGQCQFQYVGTTAGTDTIAASALFGTVGKSANARKIWISSNSQCRRTYTLDADFDLGTLFNLNYTNVHDQLQINSGGSLSTFPIMWIANAGEDSVSKIDTTTGRELARYRTWFGPAGQPGYANHLGDQYSGAAPSRTAVDREGNCYVANRHFDGRPADVIKILATGGINRNGNGVIDTSSDLNNNGVIDPGEILPMGDANGNGVIDPNEIGDERIAWAVSVGPANGLGRSLAIDGDGNIWLGLYNTRVYYKLSSVDGSILAGPIDVSPNTPYGALVDGNGILWGASLDGTLLKLDTKTNTKLNVYFHGSGEDYGIAIGNNHVYQASDSGYTYIEFDPVLETFTTPAASKFAVLGIAVDGNGDIFTGHYYGGGVTKFHPDGSEIWSSPAQPGTGEVRGCVVDSNNDIWLIHRTSNNISKHRGTDGAPLGVFPTGDGPYTYTDATGIGRFNSTAPSGTWTVIQDSGAPGTIWGTISWNGTTPPGTSIKAEVRAADTEVDLGGRNYQEVTNGMSFCDQGIEGQFIQVRATLSRPLDETNSPVLSDLTVDCCGGNANVLNLAKYSLIQGTNVTIGEVFSYEISFDTYSITNEAVNLHLVDTLPPQLDFVDVTTNGALNVVYDAATHSIDWDFGTWPPLTAGPTNIVTVRVNTNAIGGTTIVNHCSVSSSNLPPFEGRDRRGGCPECSGGGVPVAGGCVPIIQASVVETNTLRVRQTGLFYQTVGVSNPCGADIPAFRLYLEGIPADVQVYNASGFSNGVPFLLYNAPIAPNQSIEFAVEYYVTNRLTIPNPTFRGEAVVAVPPSPIETLGSIVRFVAYTNCAVLVEFSTLNNRSYSVQYASDLTTEGVGKTEGDWKTAVPSVIGNGSSVQWLDSGPPKTESPPCTQPSRYYRVVLIP